MACSSPGGGSGLTTPMMSGCRGGDLFRDGLDRRGILFRDNQQSDWVDGPSSRARVARHGRATCWVSRWNLPS